MQTLAVELRLLSELRSAELRLAPGRGLMARVVSADGHGRGTLAIAGAMIEAALPRHVRAGEQLRLVVRHLDAQRVVLELPRTEPPAPAVVALPGGGSLRVQDEEAAAGGQDEAAQTRTMSLRYETAALGPLELRFSLGPAGLSVHVAAGSGVPLQRAQAEAGALRAALAARSGQPVSVSVTPRREPLDVYA